MTSTEPKWLTVGQAAARLGVSIATLKRWEDRSDLPFAPIRTLGNQRRYRASDIDAYLRESA